MTLRRQGLRKRDGRAFAVFLVAGLTLVGCANGAAQTPKSRPKASSSALLPNSSVAAAELRPCEAVSIRQLSSIIGRTVQIDKVGDMGQRPMLSSGAVLPRIWVATCNWIVPAYSTLAPYEQLELTPSAANARTEFNGIRTKMTITNSPVHVPGGYGQTAVFNIDPHGDVTVIVLKGREVITMELNATSKHAPSATERMRMAKAITRIIVAKQQG